MRGIAAFVAFWLGVIIGIIMAASGDDWKDGLIAFAIGLLITVALVADILIRAIKWIVKFFKKLFADNESPSLFPKRSATSDETDVDPIGGSDPHSDGFRDKTL